MVPHCFVHAQADEPVVQLVVVEVVDQLPLGADGGQGLDLAGTKKMLGRDRVAAGIGIQGIDFCIHSRQDRVYDHSQYAQWMVLGYALLQAPATEQDGLSDVGSAHGLYSSLLSGLGLFFMPLRIQTGAGRNSIPCYALFKSCKILNTSR